MLYYNEIIKQNGRCQFERPSTAMCAELKEVIKSLLTDSTAGIHAMVVCTKKDYTDKVLSEEEFRRQLSERVEDTVILPQDIPIGGVGCVRLGPFEYLGQALNEMIKCVEQAVGDTYINEDAKEAVSIYYKHEKLHEKVAPRTEWNAEIADRASQVLREEKMRNTLGLVHNIYVLLILPESFFETFLCKDCYFPSFIEYVVHAVDGTQAIKTLQTQVQEKNKQLEEKNQTIEEQRQFINSVKDELTKVQSMIDMNNEAYASGATRLVIMASPEAKAQYQPETGQAEVFAQETQTNLVTDISGTNGVENHGLEAHG